MGRALAEASPVARELFQEVDEALGQNLFRLMAEGPLDELTLTENARPRSMANALATLRVLEREGGVSLPTRLTSSPATASANIRRLRRRRRSMWPSGALLKLRGQSMQAAVPVGMARWRR
jgi:[acyl-carrier-protein] S-malonyltransferase